MLDNNYPIVGFYYILFFVKNKTLLNQRIKVMARYLRSPSKCDYRVETKNGR